MRSRIAALALLLPLAAALAACDDPFGGREPVLFADTLTLATPNVDSMRLGSALSLLTGNQVIFPERIGDAFPQPQWDLSLRQAGGALVFRPLPTEQGRPGARITTGRTGSFADARTAPGDREDYEETDVPLQEGRLYFARSRSYSQFGVNCVNYSKIQPLAVRPAAGTVRLAIVTNTSCNDRRLTD